MRQMFSVLILGTMLAAAAGVAHANGATDVGLPPLDPMGGAVVLAPADASDVQPVPQPSWGVPEQDHEHSDQS